jgi:hypothetical protein
MARGTDTAVGEVGGVGEVEGVDEGGVGTGEESITAEDETGRMQVARVEGCRPWCRPVRGNRRGAAASRSQAGQRPLDWTWPLSLDTDS